MSSKTVLILGSEGAIGSRLVRSVTSAMPKTTVIRVGRSSSKFIPSAPRHIMLIGDLLDSDFVTSVFEQHDINTVFFCAAKWNGINSDPEVLDVNVAMMSNVLSAIRKGVEKFVFLSSSAVYDAGHKSDVHPIDTLPSSSYGRSKLISEMLLQNKAKLLGFDLTIYRPFHVVSPFERYCPGRSHITTDFVHRYIDLKEDFDWQSLSTNVYIPFFWVDDFCDIVVENLYDNRFRERVFNVAPAQSYSVFSLAFCVAKVAQAHSLAEGKIPTLKGELLPTVNNLPSSLLDLNIKIPNTKLHDIVEKFIVEKYRISDEC